MSDQIGINVGDAAPEAAKSAKTKPTPGAATTPVADEMAQVSTTVDPDLKALIKARAGEEDRTESVIVRRALRAYMKDWVAGQDD